MLQQDKQFVFRKYMDFYNKNGYLPKYFNPYNCSELTSIAPTVTTQCGSSTSKWLDELLGGA